MKGRAARLPLAFTKIEGFLDGLGRKGLNTVTAFSAEKDALDLIGDGSSSGRLHA